jgi:hypothetical protein
MSRIIPLWASGAKALAAELSPNSGRVDRSEQRLFREMLWSVFQSLKFPDAPARTAFEDEVLLYRALEVMYGVPLKTLIALLCGVHGQAAVKRALRKGRPYSLKDDDARIWAYVEVIRRCKGTDISSSCRRLARIGVPVKKETTEGQDTFTLNAMEAIRQRCMRISKYPPLSAVILAAALVSEWHETGEPGFDAWFKRKLEAFRRTPFPMTPNVCASGVEVRKILDDYARKPLTENRD